MLARLHSNLLDSIRPVGNEKETDREDDVFRVFLSGTVVDILPPERETLVISGREFEGQRHPYVLRVHSRHQWINKAEEASVRALGISYAFKNLDWYHYDDILVKTPLKQTGPPING